MDRHEETLKKMQTELQSILVKKGDLRKMMALGNLLRTAILLQHKRLKISKAIKELAENISGSDLTIVSAKNYLEVLAEDIEK